MKKKYEMPEMLSVRIEEDENLLDFSQPVSDGTSTGDDKEVYSKENNLFGEDQPLRHSRSLWDE